MSEAEKRTIAWKKIILNAISVIGILLAIAFFTYGIKTGIFKDEKAMAEFLRPFGIWTPVIYVAFITLQAVFMIVPGGVGNLVGLLLFGKVNGILLNYVGNVLGSALNFILARRFGRDVIKIFSSEEGFKKYEKWLAADEGKFHKWFAIAIFMPLAPDDLLCYLAGLTNMTFRKFITIILLGKPLALIFYSLFLESGFQWILRYLGW